VIWDFFQRYDESWIWRCVDRHTTTESSRNFAALEECIADAVRHGYVPRPMPGDARPHRSRGRRKDAAGARGAETN
jgi:hypothetical protein